MRRLVWIGIGVALGVGLALAAYSRLNAAKKAASQAISPDGLARGLDRAVALASELLGEISQSARQRETELRRVLLRNEPT
ncbi:MAG: hypothetical protein LBJ62_00865 [Bifidobacteriaceae bacterium]|jgi:hypothetical protein|nr:hypothetical protein [Bifidobacteriaceae bacterium]